MKGKQRSGIFEGNSGVAVEKNGGYFEVAIHGEFEVFKLDQRSGSFVLSKTSTACLSRVFRSGASFLFSVECLFFLMILPELDELILIKRNMGSVGFSVDDISIAVEVGFDCGLSNIGSA